MKNGFSILFSMILLASQMSLSFGTHLCGGEAVKSKILIGETHLECSMIDMDQSCDIPVHNDNKNTLLDNDLCCDNEYHTVQFTDEFINDAAQSIYKIDFAAAFTYTTLNLDLFPKSTHQFYTEYISPPIEKDIQVLFQSFLI